MVLKNLLSVFLLLLATLVFIACDGYGINPYKEWPPQKQVKMSDSNGTSTKSSSSSSSIEITYVPGKSVMSRGINMYYIWYGDTWTLNQRHLLEDFGNIIGKSDWWSTSRKYYYQANDTSPREYLSCEVHHALSVNTSAKARGNRLTYLNVEEVIKDTFVSGQLPEDDEHGLYVVFTDSKTRVQDFCKYYCGYHWYFNGSAAVNGRGIPYILVGNPKMCGSLPNACAVQKESPNGDAHVDAMISIFAHEITEAATDPFGDAWQALIPSSVSSDGTVQTWESWENADLCAWNFDPIFSLDGGSSAYFNTEIEGRKYLIQSNWDPDIASCIVNGTVGLVIPPCPANIPNTIAYKKAANTNEGTTTTSAQSTSIFAGNPIDITEDGKSIHQDPGRTQISGQKSHLDLLLWITIGVGISVTMILLTVFLIWIKHRHLSVKDAKMAMKPSSSSVVHA